MSVATRTGERIEPPRYRTAHAERVVVGQRVLGIVRVSDVPATGRGRRYLVERELTLKAQLDARRRLPRGSGGPGRLSHAGLAGRPRAGADAMSAPRRHFNLDRL